MKGQTSSYWFYFSKLTTIMCTWRETTPSQMHLATEQWVTHSAECVSVSVCTSMCRFCISSVSVFLSCISWFCLASSSHTCWALLWQWRSNCCSLQNTHTHRHTHSILAESVWEERTLLADIKPNVVNIERELDPQRAFNITGLCVDQVINTVYMRVTAVFVL